MTRKIFRPNFGTAMLILLVSLALFVSILHSYFDGQVFDELGAEARYVAQGVELSGMDYFDGLRSANRVTYIAPDGTVLYDSEANPDEMENHASRDEIMSALKNGASTSSRYSETLSQNTLYYAIRLSDSTIVRVASRQSTVLALAAGMLPAIAVTICLAALLSALLSRRLARRITEPILSLDLDRPEDCDTYEELSPLLGKIRHQNETIHEQMAKLKKSQEEFTAITENMSEGFLLIDRQTRLLSCNSSALRLLGAKDARTGESVLALERGESFRKVVDEALAGRHSEALLHIDERCYQLYANSVSSGGEVVGAVIAVLDVTEREERETLRREFTANVTHELKTPLTSISGFAEIMMGGLVPPESIPEFAGDIYGEAQRLIRLVDDILHLSRLDEDAPMPRAEIELRPMCESIAERLAPAAEKAGVKISVSGSSPVVTGVSSVVDEIIFNLCDNAVKYNRPGGSVRLTLSETKGAVRVAVADTGIGIPAADQERVFERFYRVDKSHSKEIGGTGLGLSIVKHGCASQGIALSLESEPGAGTTVTLTWNK